MNSDYCSKAWANDIQRFEKARYWLARTRTQGFRDFLIGQMKAIKAKYPQHIKDEIPDA